MCNYSVTQNFLKVFFCVKKSGSVLKISVYRSVAEAITARRLKLSGKLLYPFFVFIIQLVDVIVMSLLCFRLTFGYIAMPCMGSSAHL
jgi:hypothetical protein